MKLIRFFLILFLTSFLISCSKDTAQKSIMQEKSLELQVLEAYEAGMKTVWRVCEEVMKRVLKGWEQTIKIGMRRVEKG